jgi:hypothetical protein
MLHRQLFSGSKYLCTPFHAPLTNDLELAFSRAEKEGFQFPSSQYTLMISCCQCSSQQWSYPENPLQYTIHTHTHTPSPRKLKTYKKKFPYEINFKIKDNLFEFIVEYS